MSDSNVFSLKSRVDSISSKIVELDKAHILTDHKLATIEQTVNALASDHKSSSNAIMTKIDAIHTAQQRRIGAGEFVKQWAPWCLSAIAVGIAAYKTFL